MVSFHRRLESASHVPPWFVVLGFFGWAPVASTRTSAIAGKTTLTLEKAVAVFSWVLLHVDSVKSTVNAQSDTVSTSALDGD